MSRFWALSFSLVLYFPFMTCSKKYISIGSDDWGRWLFEGIFYNIIQRTITFLVQVESRANMAGW